LTIHRPYDGGQKVSEPVDVSKKHFYISLVKSATRIVGCVAALATGSWGWLAAGLLVAEVLGILEEL
jgi:hypothetical protein